MKVKDLGQVAFLRLKGYEFNTQYDKETKKVLFDFKGIEDEKALLQEYWNSDFYKFKLMMDSSRKIITNVKEKR